jgi:hypothetical protein
MAHTITIEEVNKNKAEIDQIVLRTIRRYVDASSYSSELSESFIKDVQALMVYKYIIDSWEQGEFTNQEYTNYLNSVGYLTLINKIKSTNV